MNDQQSKSPSQTQPRRRNGQVSQRGMLSVVMLFVSVGTLGISMIGGAKLAYDILGPDKDKELSLFAAVIALGVAYLVGWVTAMVAIRVYGNLILPILINWIMWGCMVGICFLYLEIMDRLYAQKYDLWHYWEYILVMAAGLTVLVGLHLINEGHNLRPFSYPLLIISVIQLALIVYRYVFEGSDNNLYLLGDIFFLAGMSAFSMLMLAHVGLLDPIRNRVTTYFDMNSTSIRTQD